MLEAFEQQIRITCLRGHRGVPEKADTELNVFLPSFLPPFHRPLHEHLCVLGTELCTVCPGFSRHAEQCPSLCRYDRDELSQWKEQARGSINRYTFGEIFKKVNITLITIHKIKCVLLFKFLIALFGTPLRKALQTKGVVIKCF